MGSNPKVILKNDLKIVGLDPVNRKWGTWSCDLKCEGVNPSDFKVGDFVPNDFENVELNPVRHFCVFLKFWHYYGLKRRDGECEL